MGHFIERLHWTSRFALIHDFGPPLSGEPSTAGPEKIAFGPAYPNPARDRFVIDFDLPASAHVRLTLIDLLGREVAILRDEWVSAGPGRADVDDVNLAPGLYLLRLEAGATALTRSVTVVR